MLRAQGWWESELIWKVPMASVPCFAPFLDNPLDKMTASQQFVPPGRAGLYSRPRWYSLGANGKPHFFTTPLNPSTQGPGTLQWKIYSFGAIITFTGHFLKIKTPLKRTSLFHHSFRRWLSSGATDPSFIKTQATCLERKESVSWKGRKEV